MDYSSPSSPVIVGIDGSTAALRAALWAVDEAVSRDTPLRLVHVVPASSHDLDEALADARDVLHKAWTEVEATGKPVKIESDIVHGDPGQALIEASRAAQLVCVGSKGTHDSPRGRRASTAATLARGAASPVVERGRTSGRKGRAIRGERVSERTGSSSAAASPTVPIRCLAAAFPRRISTSKTPVMARRNVTFSRTSAAN